MTRDRETQFALEKAAACKEFIKKWVDAQPKDSPYLKEPMSSIMIGNLGHAWYEGTRFKASVILPDEEIEHLTKFSSNNAQ